ncbi:MAG: aminotransferase class V-fold PLP-dependent enzyme [Candidatus Eisenbacteria sp.]|nr:aminotransferase class V-fold PLP-dependent enzyme [Candidatus Eisenbacteria bacterium]
MLPADQGSGFATSLPEATETGTMPEVLGARREVPLLDGRRVAQVFLDNAASTKPLRRVSEYVRAMEDYYSNIHRGTGYDSVFCTQQYEEAREIVAAFVGGDPVRDVAIPVRNATEGLNLLASTFEFRPADIVLTTLLEHHSNDLPWRGKARVEYVGLRPDTTLDLAEYEARLQALRGRVRIVAVTGASNVTGEVLPVHRLAEIAHRNGALIVIDAAQLAPHRGIDMRPHGRPDHLDFVVFSAHKMNSPYGEGAIIGPQSHFNAAAPYLQGGGTVYHVGLDHVIWADAPDRQEAGTPNVLGLLALAAAIRIYQQVGWDAIVAHERELTRRLLRGMAAMPQVEILGPANADDLGDRLGVVAFSVVGLHYQFVAAVLSYEFGIAVRAGCFCAHPLIKHLLKVTRDRERAIEGEVQSGDRREVPGAVRASIGLHNTPADIDRFLEALGAIAARRWRGRYVQETRTGAFHPEDYTFDFSTAPQLPD